MKRIHIIRALSLLLCLVTLMTLSLLPASASEDIVDSETEEFCATWSYNEATGELIAYFPDADTDTAKVYTEVTLPARVIYHPTVLYEYANTVSIGDSEYVITAFSRHEDTVALANQRAPYETRLFITESARADIRTLLENPDFASALLIDRDGYIERVAYLASDIPSKLASLPAEGQVTYTLYDLTNEASYTLLGLCSPFAAVQGYVYEMNEALYYLDASTLSDACFNSEGRLNPMKTVTVTLTPLTPELSEAIYEGLEDMRSYNPSLRYEIDDAPYDPTAERIAGIVMLCIAIVPVGLWLPIPTLVMGLILPHLRAFGKKKRWYALTAVSGICMLLSVILLITVTVAVILI